MHINILGSPKGMHGEGPRGAGCWLLMLAKAVACAIWLSSGCAAFATQFAVVPQATESRAGGITMAQLVYKPPLRGAPATRVGSGSRGIGDTLRLSVLAPVETGFTVQEQPSIYWFASEAIDVQVELLVIRAESPQASSRPLLQVTLQPPIGKGIHALHLSEHAVSLEPGVEYQWFVAAVRDPARRSNDVLAGGTIQRVPERTELRSRLKRSARTQWPAVYAEAGIWYDAIDQLSRQIRANSSERQPRAQRAALLDQVGLREVAAYDRGR